MKRPEGLSPAYGSFVSPDVQESFMLSWVFRGEYGETQSKASVVIKKGSTTLATKTVTGASTSFSLSDAGITWEENVDYTWSITPYNQNGSAGPVSNTMTFRYALLPKKPGISWEDGPEPFEYIGTRKYFNTIQKNSLVILADYGLKTKREQDLYAKIEKNMFMGDVVPDRKDFILVEELLALVSEKEFTLPPEVQQLIEDDLGAGDIHRIYKMFDYLAKRDPESVPGVDIFVPGMNAPAIASFTASIDNKEDSTVDLKWTTASQAKTYGEVTILGQSRSEDVRYYQCQLTYGSDVDPLTSTLYYRPVDFERIGYKIRFEMDYASIYTKETLSRAYESFYVVAVDHRDNRSDSFGKKLIHGPNYKVPLGLDYYEIQMEKNGLGANTPNGWNWNWIANSQGSPHVHGLPNNSEGTYFFRIRFIDRSGLQGEWRESNGVKYDPLKPPPPPKNLRPILIDINVIQWQWDRSPTADGYNVSFPTDNYSGGPTTDDKWWKEGLGEGSWNEIRVQAYNRAGTSSWVGIWTQTKTRPPVEEYQQTPTADCWRTAYTINGGRSWNAAAWRLDSWDVARNEIIQGMWIELRSGINTDGRWVPAGTTYGNHKSLVYFNRSYWQNKLRGKEILEVKIYLKRKSTQHGYPNDGRYIQFWTHNYDSRPSGEPWLGNPHRINDANIGRGQGRWFTLPNYYGEYLRDGKMCGIALHADFRTVDKDQYTYMRFEESETQLFIKYK